MSEISEIDCSNCQAACCQGGTIELTLDELSFMLRGGNRFITIEQPADYERDNVFCPSFSVQDDREPNNVKFYGVNQPLGAGLGRYFMKGACVFLEVDESGWQKCGVYEQRPGTCERFEVAGSQCKILREISGVDEISPETQAILDVVNETFED